MIDRLDVSSPRDGAVFWSGAKEAAKAHAADIGGVAIESTPGGRVVDEWPLLNEHLPWHQGGKQFWRDLFSNYAEGASGNIHVAQSESAAARGGGLTWKEVEEPILQCRIRAGEDINILPTTVVPDSPSR